jgi:hypothetical protein
MLAVKKKNQRVSISMGFFPFANPVKAAWILTLS